MSDAPGTDTPASDAPATEAPFLRIVSGNPTDEDIAVLTVVLAAAGSDPAPAPVDRGPRDQWGQPGDLLRSEWQGGPRGYLYGRP